MATRITQNAVEVLVSATPLVRVTQNAPEVLVTATPLVRVTQNAPEALVTGGANARVTQVATEVLDQSSVIDARVTQVAVEVLDQPNTSLVDARVTQIAIEVLRHNSLITETFTADARIRPRGEGSFSADAITYAVHRNTLAVDAYIGKQPIAVDAVLKRSWTNSFLANSVIVNYRAQFTINAYIAQRFHANAVIRKTSPTKTFTADALYGRFFWANAAIRRTTGKSFTIDARFLRHSFTASAVIAPIAAGQPGGPPAGTVLPLSIKVSGLDITKDVEIATAKFTQAVNARPGEFSFEVKDDEHIYQFVSGGRVTCDINGHRLFDGYVTRATMHYAFPVDIVTAPETTARLWKLEGPDLNILFQKRYIYDQVNPNADLPMFAENTSDKTIILTYIDEYLDLHDDEITTSGVTAVGTSNPDGLYSDQRGSTWGAAMDQIAQLPGAVWGLTQDRDLFYEDDDTESAPFRLSDTPNGTTTIGYSNFVWTDDGTKLVNDVQVWGAGTGSTVKVFAEVEDATSIAEHGRWQLPGQYRSDMFRQTTVTNAAESIVYGSTQNLHGGKDPYILVNCRIKQHGLRAGMKVRIFNNVYGMDQVLPIRRMTMTFVNKDDVLYDLELTREIDQPWFFAEFAGFPKFPPTRRPGLQCPPGFVRAGGRCIPTQVYEHLTGCNNQVCGITDSFDRPPDPFGWGRSDVYADWELTTSGYGKARTDGDRGWMKAVRGQPCGMELVGASITAPIEVRFEFLISAINNMPLDWLTFDIGGARLRIDYGSDNHVFGGSGTELWINEANTANSNAMKHSYTAGVVHHVHLTFVPGPGSNGLITASVWPFGTPEPTTPELSVVSTLDLQDINPTFEVSSTNPPQATEPYGPESVNSADGPIVYINDLNIVGVNRCTNVQFDDFNRTVASGWGTATPGGYAWGITGVDVGVVAFASVDGAKGKWVYTTSGAHSFSTAPYTFVDPTDAYCRGITWAITDLSGLPSTDEIDIYFGRYQLRLEQVWDGTQNVRGYGGGWMAAPFNLVGPFDLHVFISSTAFKFRGWATGTTEPDTWDYEFDASGDPGIGSDIQFDVVDNYHGMTFSIDSIDFDYAGKPCYISCPAIDYTVYPSMWVLTPAVGCTVFGFRSCASNGLYDPDAGVWNPSGFVYMYGGATYEVEYEVVHSYSSQNLVPSLVSAYAVSTGNASECWLWPVPAPIPPINSARVIGTQFASAWMYAYLGSSMCCCNSNVGSSMVAWIRYVSGPDPRFEGLAAEPCVPISSATGQPAPTQGASGTQTGERIDSTTYEVWVQFIPGSTTVWLNGRLMRLTYDYTEDPIGARINFVMPVDVNDVVYITYLAIGPATPTI